MENQETPQQFSAPVTEINPANQTEIPQLNKKSKKRIVLVVIALLFVLLGFAGAYAYFVYLPESPEMVLKKATENFFNNKTGYKVEGRLDQGNVNLPDFNYTVKTDASGNTSATVSSFILVSSPGAEIITVDGKTYIKPDGFRDSQELAKQYTNASGEVTLEEQVSNFVDYSDLALWNGKWLEVPSYLNDSIVTSDNEGSGESKTNIDEQARLVSVGEVKEVDGRKVREYTLEVDANTLQEILEQLAGGTVADTFANYSSKNELSEKLEFKVLVDIATKKFYKIDYDGRPFSDATLSIHATESSDTITAAEGSVKLSEALSYGVAWSGLIRADMQNGKTERDNERIADLKGMKLAFEIYKAKNGTYPDRYNIAVQQEQFLNTSLPYVDHGLFKDPADRRAGLNGSQYAYVSQTKDGDEFCGPNNGPLCEKFFIVTTLDDGTEYQLNSD